MLPHFTEGKYAIGDRRKGRDGQQAQRCVVFSCKFLQIQVRVESVQWRAD